MRVWMMAERRRLVKKHCAYVVALMLYTATLSAQSENPRVQVDWNKVDSVSRTTPTLQVVVNPQLRRGAKLHDGAFHALRELGAEDVRYVPWLPYPRLAVAELEPPADGKTSWDFSLIDPMMEDFIHATEGHPVVVNFSTMPAWLWKTDKPVEYPADPWQVAWNYTQGTELRDPSMQEAAQYYARLLAWYTQGGFTDEAGKRHESGHHYKIAVWEVLNEVDSEHSWTPESYTRFYDAVVSAMRAAEPKLQFMGLALAHEDNPKMFEYFLDPAHHQPGTPLDYISYHFYATPREGEDLQTWQYTFWNQAETFLRTVRYAEAIRKRLSPATKVDLDELGAILPEDGKDNDTPGYTAPPPPAKYWNLAGALYAYLYIETAKLGIDIVGESQLVGYHTQYPSVTMIDNANAQPNARFCVLELLKDNFGPGDQLIHTEAGTDDVAVQAFATTRGKRLLLINRRDRMQQVTLPADAQGGHVTMVAPSTGDDLPMKRAVAGATLSLEPFEVAVIAY
jgi:hypothetical protein